MEERPSREKCKVDLAARREFRKDIPAVVRELVLSCDREDCFDHVSPEPLPSRDAAIDLIRRAMRILYPGYFIRSRVDEVNLDYYFGQEVMEFYEHLSEQLTLSVRHECLRHDLPCTRCEERGQEAALDFLKRIPDLRAVLAKDVRAAFEGDPAAGSYDEIIFSYPGLFAVTVHRIAHRIHEMEIPLIPRIMSEYAHSHTGIDIHPAAHIGESFFIDHGTGVVIGETCVIGDRVRLYQGVTLGALSIPRDATEGLRKQKRHPTIEDDVVIYAGATILGGETVIGARSVIGGNVWITESVPQDTKVFLKKPELVIKGN
ncbi:MAG: serine acetyltransferase [Deltaproteobacteria bacterium]|nr:serine acetyltransferase [Deltaproteobacteria bacterium]